MNKSGGGSLTNAHGLYFEQETSLSKALSNAGYTVLGCNIFKDGKRIAISVPKNKLYTELLEPNGIDFKQYISKKLLPDEALYIFSKNIIYIMEKKFQNRSGSVDEKIQTCAFKKRQYTRLLKNLKLSVEYVYIFNDWFQQPEYRDALEYIIESQCYYFFNEIPLSFLQLSS